MIYAVLFILVFALFLWLGLPKLLKMLGLHPDYHGPKFSLPNGRALIITTSHDTLDKTGKATGVFASEMTEPYYAFKEGGMSVDVASIKGGSIPIEKDSFKWFIASKSDKRYLQDPEFQHKAQHSLAIADLDFTHYDIIFLAGGWGAAYDLAESETLGEKISQAWQANKVMGGVCHGPLGLLKAKDSNGEVIVKDKQITAVTNKQIKQLGITHTPYHPETELRKAGAKFMHAPGAIAMFSNLTHVDGRLVTGQNQNAGEETAHKMMQVAGGIAC